LAVEEATKAQLSRELHDLVSGSVRARAL